VQWWQADDTDTAY